MLCLRSIKGTKTIERYFDFQVEELDHLIVHFDFQLKESPPPGPFRFPPREQLIRAMAFLIRTRSRRAPLGS